MMTRIVPPRVTPTRVLLTAAAAGNRLYQEAGQIWRQVTETRVTAAARYLIRGGWLTVGAEISPGKVQIVPTPAGRSALSDHHRCGGCGVEHSTHRQPPRAVCQHTVADHDRPCPELDVCLVWDLCPTCWGGSDA